MRTAIIDMDEDKPGVQEDKEWLALLGYIRQMKDTNGNRLHDLDKKYSEPVRSFFIVR
jgi:Mor family transcriptional regulator